MTKATNVKVRGLKLHSWRRQLPDHRDRRFGGEAIPPALPARVNPLAMGKTVIHDQGMTNSCVGHAVTTALELALGLPKDQGLSRNMAYYHARALIGEEKFDEGCYIRDAFKQLVNVGVCKETSWRFAVDRLFLKPTATAMKRAAEMKQVIADAGIVYEAPRTLHDIKAAIAAGQAVVFGFTVYENIFDINDDNLVLRMPTGSMPPLGGHAVVADGYDDATGLISVQNSWGRPWGKDGYFFMPYDWFTATNYQTGDFWTCRKTK